MMLDKVMNIEAWRTLQSLNAGQDLIEAAMQCGSSQSDLYRNMAPEFFVKTWGRLGLAGLIAVAFEQTGSTSHDVANLESLRAEMRSLTQVVLQL